MELNILLWTEISPKFYSLTQMYKTTLKFPFSISTERMIAKQ